jgi:hypothetical protein
MTSAQHYRERNSGEIIAEQQELEKLKRISLIDNCAWWEWDSETYRFNVSKEWEVLTGYSADKVFPQDLSPEISIESRLESLCNRWLDFVAESDRAESEKLIKDFLLLNNKSSFFEHGYHLKMANGTTRMVFTTARSVWTNGRLISLFAQTRDIERWMTPSTSAVEIAKNTESTKRTQAQLAKFIQETSGLIPYLKTQGPGIVAFVLSMFALIASNIIPFRRELYKIKHAWDAPLTIDESMARSPDLSFFERLDDQTVEQAGLLLADYGLYGKSIRLAFYDHPVTPDRFQYLIQASKDPKDSASPYPQNISISVPISRRFDEHTGGQPSWIEDGFISKHSVAFTITADDLSQQLFFVEVMNGGDAISPKNKLAIEAATKELAVRMKTLLDEASAL